MSLPVPVAERTAHPFYTYDMIRDIPKALRATFEAIRDAEVKPSSGPLVFTGNGTAFYSAVMGSQILSLSDVEWRAVQAFELERYETHLGRGGLVVGVSHSGITKSTVDALARARSQGAHTIGITHFQDRPISSVCDTTLVVGDGPDKSRCHTKTYVDSAAAIFELLSSKLLQQSTFKGELENVRREFESQLVRKIEAAISSTDAPARKAAAELHGKISKILFAGAGPNYITTREAALKIKETSYLAAEGMELEEILHGTAMSFNSESLVVVLAPSGPSVDRARTLLSAAKWIGAKTLLMSDSGTTFEHDAADYQIQVPSTHEYLSPFLCIIPLYFFAYYLAVEFGNNPDYLRYLDQRYWNARTIIFPPGTH